MNYPRWPATKQAPIEGFRHCLNCPPRAQFLPLDSIMAVGFGEVRVTKNNEIVWSGDDEYMQLGHFEKQAESAPRYDWRVEFIGPLYEATYQRHRKGRWALISRGEGFT